RRLRVGFLPARGGNQDRHLPGPNPQGGLAPARAGHHGLSPKGARVAAAWGIPTRRFIPMIRDWLTGLRKYFAGACAALLVGAGVSRADDKDAELRALVEQQGKQIQELKRQLETEKTQPVAVPGAPGAPAAPGVDAEA